MADASLLARRQQEETFASALARRLGTPGEAWEECASLLGLSWEHFLLLAITKLPRTEEAVTAVADAFGLPQTTVLALSRGEIPAVVGDGR